jgi:hypothetical protein
MSVSRFLSLHASRLTRTFILLAAALMLTACGYADPRGFFSDDPAAGYVEADAGGNDETGSDQGTEGDSNPPTDGTNGGDDGESEDGDGPGLNPTPSLAALVSGDGQLTVNWDAIENAVAYEVFYGNDPDIANASLWNDTVGRITGTSTTITGLDNSLTYTVWVRPVFAVNPPGTARKVGERKPDATTFTVDASNVFPPENAQEIDPKTDVAIGFSGAVDATTVTATTVTAETGDGTPIDLNIAVSNTANDIVEIAPQAGSWPAASEVIVRIQDGVFDANGTALESPYNLSFSTVDPGGMSAWFTFDGANPYEDASGNGNNLVGADWVSTSDQVTGQQSLFIPMSDPSRRTNTSDRVMLGDVNYDLGPQFTISMWIKLNTLQSDINGLVVNGGAGRGSSGFKLGINNWRQTDAAVTFEAGDGTYGGVTSTDPNFVTPGNWYHFAFVVDTQQPLIEENSFQYHAAIYFNGERAQDLNLAYEHMPTDPNPIDWSAMSTTGPFSIGQFSDGYYTANDIMMDDLRFYTRTLEPDEIKNLAR